MKKLTLWIAAGLLLCASVAYAKPFGKTPGAPGVLIGEVASYGDYALQPYFFETFLDLLTEKLQDTRKFRVESRRMTAPDIPDDEAGIFSRIHMDAIARGHQYRREMAGVHMIRYADALMGKAYYQNEARALAWRKQADAPYSLSPEVRGAAQEIGEIYGVEYLVFCDMYDVNIALNRSLFNAKVSDIEMRAKEIHSDMNYYLVHTRTGRVFEGHNEMVKRGQIINILIDKYGKGFTVEQMLHCVLETQAKKTADRIAGTGLKSLGRPAEEAANEGDL